MTATTRSPFVAAGQLWRPGDAVGEPIGYELAVETRPAETVTDKTATTHRIG